MRSSDSRKMRRLLRKLRILVGQSLQHAHVLRKLIGHGIELAAKLPKLIHWMISDTLGKIAVRKRRTRCVSCLSRRRIPRPANQATRRPAPTKQRDVRGATKSTRYDGNTSSQSWGERV
jgi:hypothetical protein